MSIIIPAGIDQEEVRVPMEFPLRADADIVMDKNGKTVFTMDDSIAIGESIKFTKLFAKAPDMWELLGDCYVALAIVARNTEGIKHGLPDEEDKEHCLLCRLESLLQSIQ
jgi:hypothetical protein